MNRKAGRDFYVGSANDQDPWKVIDGGSVDVCLRQDMDLHPFRPRLLHRGKVIGEHACGGIQSHATCCSVGWYPGSACLCDHFCRDTRRCELFVGRDRRCVRILSLLLAFETFVVKTTASNAEDETKQGQQLTGSR